MSKHVLDKIKNKKKNLKEAEEKGGCYSFTDFSLKQPQYRSDRGRVTHLKPQILISRLPFVMITISDEYVATNANYINFHLRMI